MPLLEMTRVSKRFGGLQVLDRVDLFVARGDVYGLIGPNGAGKTTLFNVISGFLRPDAGHVRYGGADLAGLRPHEVCRRGIGRTFQLVQPFADMTVLDNVAAGALFGRGRVASIQDARTRARHLLELFGLDAKAGWPAESLTLAERKRLEIVRALATGPELLLLDEVMAGLTSTEGQEIATVIRRTQAEFRLTILIIEHNVKLVTGLANRMAVLNHGKIIAEGEPADVVRRPEVVTAYLGERRGTSR